MNEDMGNNHFRTISPEVYLRFINDKSFDGNPYLCPPNDKSTCPILTNHDIHDHHHLTFSFSLDLIASTASILFFLVLIIFVLLFYTKRRSVFHKPNTWKLTTFKRLNFEVEDVLKCLNTENIIGRGGAGIVYHGSMPDGTEVAIKKLIGKANGRRDCVFSAEIKTLGKVRHRYIMRFLGYMSNKESNILLYQYMENGSLGEILHGPNGAHLLLWEMKYKIAVESAKGLSYLHHDCSPLIIHRDVKSNNILLDLNMEAHVADFGLAKFFRTNGVSEVISSIAGSFGFIAPSMRLDDSLITLI